MTNVKTGSGELYYLRLLLLHVTRAQATSWSSLKRRPPGASQATFQEYARELGLLHDDVETQSMLSEACATLTSTTKLCELFAETLVWPEVHDPRGLWNHFLSRMELSHRGTETNTLYSHVDAVLSLYGSSLMGFNIQAPPTHTAASPASRAELEYSAELRDQNQRKNEDVAFEELSLNDDQQEAYNAVWRSINNPTDYTIPNVVYVDGPAGSGKTHLYRNILHSVRRLGGIALAMAMSGIAALLLPGGRTVHSWCRLPVPTPWTIALQ
jgi:ATPase involved in DNA replication initiation